MKLQSLHLLASLALTSATSLECAIQSNGECIENKSKKCLDAAAFEDLVASFHNEDESVLPLLRGSVDNVLTPEEVDILYTKIPYRELIYGWGYSKNTIEPPPAISGIGLQELSTNTWGDSRYNTVLELRYNKILEVREKVRSSAESALGLCPGTLLIHFTGIVQKGVSGAHGTHADNCYHYFDETTGKAMCKPEQRHPYPKRVAASITYLNDQSPDSGNFAGGEFYWANRTLDKEFPQPEETEEVVPIEAGKMVYFTSGTENMHGGLPVRKREDHQFGNPEPHRRALAIWYVFDKSMEEQVPPSFVKKIDVRGVGEGDGSGGNKENLTQQGSCMDNYDKCNDWASKGHCDANPIFMLLSCRKSCMVCSERTPNTFYSQSMEYGYVMRRIISYFVFGPKTADKTNKVKSSAAQVKGDQNKAGLEVEVGCFDKDEKCAEYAMDEGCEKNPGYMHHYCAASCNTCVCKDDNYRCKEWAGKGECEAHHDWMHHYCKRSCMVCSDGTSQFGVEQKLPNYANEPERQKTRLQIEESIEYMKTVWSDEKYSQVRHRCKNLDEKCSFWAATGECENNQMWMQANCAPACSSCDTLDLSKRCPIKPGNECIWKPGDLNTLMENIVDNADGSGEYAKYNPKALSRPQQKQDGPVASTAQRKRNGIPASDEVPQRKRQGLPASDVVPDGPWVVSLENFVTEEEADRLVEIGKMQGYKRSIEVGEELPDGSHGTLVSQSRTSTNSWCQEGCMDDPLVLPVIERIANVTKTEVKNSENLQLLNYKPGQFYKQHHDFLPHQVNMPCGVRILTLFIYLSDVEEGGGTHFPRLNITVQPKKGNAILWPSVLDHSPESKDERTDHEALPVIKGEKFGANAWIHSRDMMQAFKDGCH